MSPSSVPTFSHTAQATAVLAFLQPWKNWHLIFIILLASGKGLLPQENCPRPPTQAPVLPMSPASSIVQSMQHPDIILCLSWVFHQLQLLGLQGYRLFISLLSSKCDLYIRVNVGYPPSSKPGLVYAKGDNHNIYLQFGKKADALPKGSVSV